MTRPAAFAVVVGLCVATTGLWLGTRRREPDRRIVSLSVSASGRWIAGGTHIGSITVLDRDNPGTPQRIRDDVGVLNDLQFSPDEQLLAVANRGLNAYPVGGLNRPHSLRSDHRNYGTVRFSSDGRRLLTTTGAATIEVLDTDFGDLKVKVCCSTIGGEAAFSPDGSMIVTAGHWPALWDARSGKVVRRLTEDREFLTFLPIAFDPMRGWVLMGSQDGRVYCWDMHTGQRTATSQGHAGYVESIAVLKDSIWIAYAALGGPVRLWDPESGEERMLGTITATSNLIAGTQPHSILFGTATGFVELWDTNEQKQSQQYDLR